MMELFLVALMVVFVALSPVYSHYIGAGTLLALLLLRAFADGPLLRGAVSVVTPGAVVGIGVLLISVTIALRGRGLLKLLPLLVFLAVSTAFATTGAVGSDAWVELLALLSTIFFGLAFANLRKRPDPLLVTRWIQVIALCSAVFSIVQWATGTGLVVDGVIRPSGLMAHPNSAALLYGMACMMTVFRLSTVRSAWAEWSIGIMLLAALVVTGSLGGIAALLVMLLTYALVSGTLRGHLRLSVIVVGLVVAAVFVLSPIGEERLAAFTNIDFSGAAGERNSLEWRVGRWRTLLELGAESPAFGLGYGASTSGSLLPGGYPPHNEYIRVLVDTGIVGLLIAVVVVVAAFAWLRKIIRTNTDLIARRLAGLVTALLVGLLVSALTENTFTYSIPMYMLAALLGTLAQVVRIHASPVPDERRLTLAQ